jgi:hypothetical protein
MAFRVQIRRDTAINWQAVNPILLEGEMGLELGSNCLKIGDGVTPWSSLPYFICQGGATGPGI